MQATGDLRAGLRAGFKQLQSALGDDAFPAVPVYMRAFNVLVDHKNGQIDAGAGSHSDHRQLDPEHIHRGVPAPATDDREHDAAPEPAAAARHAQRGFRNRAGHGLARGPIGPDRGLVGVLIYGAVAVGIHRQKYVPRRQADTGRDRGLVVLPVEKAVGVAEAGIQHVQRFRPAGLGLKAGWAVQGPAGGAGYGPRMREAHILSMQMILREGHLPFGQWIAVLVRPPCRLKTQIESA